MPRCPRAALLATFVAGCGLTPYNVDGTAIDTAVGTIIPDRPCGVDMPHTWENFGEDFVTRHCADCHRSDLSGDVARSEAPETVNLESRELLQSWIQRVYARAADENTSMPPSGRIDAADRYALGDWLACGAP